MRRVLRDDGTLWLNLGDSYAAQRGGTQMPAETLAGGEGGFGAQDAHRGRVVGAHQAHRNASAFGLKHKDLVGVPWMVAFALRADGWYLRSDIIWSKPNPMPESVRDRPTKAHEYLFLLSKSERYYYDAEAIAEPALYAGLTGQSASGYKDAQLFNGKHRRSDKQRGHGRRHAGFNDRWDAMKRAEQCSGTRNKRSVWTISTMPYGGTHFAVMPEKLVEPCILAGCPEGGIVLDPFFGSGTVGQVAERLGRRWFGCELNPAYKPLIDQRTAQVGIVFTEKAAEP